MSYKCVSHPAPFEYFLLCDYLLSGFCIILHAWLNIGCVYVWVLESCKAALRTGIRGRDVVFSRVKLYSFAQLSDPLVKVTGILHAKARQYTGLQSFILSICPSVQKTQNWEEKSVLN